MTLFIDFRWSRDDWLSVLLSGRPFALSCSQYRTFQGMCIQKFLDIDRAARPRCDSSIGRLMPGAAG